MTEFHQELANNVRGNDANIDAVPDVIPDADVDMVADHSIANSSLVPTSLYLHSNSTQILALKKKGFSEKKKSSQKKIFFFNLFSMQLFSADAMVFSKKI